MIMADILKIFLLVVGGVLVFIAFWLAAEALFPALVERARGQYGRPWRLTFAGLAMAAPFVAIAFMVRISCSFAHCAFVLPEPAS